jgi:NitT/TauT family transport system substrate-binding protein
MKRPKTLRVGLAIAVTAIFATQAHAEAIKIGVSKVLSYSAAPIALEKGYFKAEGFDAELVFFESAQPIAVAVTSGGIDYGVAGVTAGLYSLAGQGALKIIGGAAAEAPGFHNFAYLVSNRAFDSGLKSFKDLPGRTLALTQVGTTLYYNFGQLADKYGFDIKTVRVVALQSNPNVISGLAGGQADFAVMPAATALPALAKSEIRLMGWVGDETPGAQTSLILTSSKAANDKPDQVNRFLRAYRHGARDYHDAFIGADEKPHDGPGAPQLLPILSKFVELSPGQVKEGLPWIDAEGRLNVKDVIHQIEWDKAQGLLKPEIDGKNFIDMRFVVER